MYSLLQIHLLSNLHRDALHLAFDRSIAYLFGIFHRYCGSHAKGTDYQFRVLNFIEELCTFSYFPLRLSLIQVSAINFVTSLPDADLYHHLPLQQSLDHARISQPCFQISWQHPHLDHAGL